MAFAIYGVLAPDAPPDPASNGDLAEARAPFSADFDANADALGAARAIENIALQHRTLIDWQSNPEVLRELRRDVKRELRSRRYAEERLDAQTGRIVDVLQRSAEA